MSKSGTPIYTAFRYMSRFRCIGSECEASCCTGGWGITVDREHYRKLKAAMGTNPRGRQEFDAGLKRVKDVARTDHNHALIVLQDNGDCGFLREDRLCSLQQRFGAEVLSNTCTMYPRAVAVSGDRKELAGVPSCPEVARQLLLHDDAMELDEVTADVFARPIVQTRLGDHPEQPYLRYHDELRSLMFDLLTGEEYPLRSRLSFIAYFASRTAEFLHRDATVLDEPRLLAEVERIQDPNLRRELHNQFEALSTDAEFPARIVLALVAARAKVEGFRQLLDRAIVSYAGPSALEHARQGVHVELAAREIMSAYAERKAAWSKFEPRIDRYFTNYAKNFWAREWYLTSPNLLAHALQLLVRLATLRFLLFGHPLLLAARQASEAEQGVLLDRAAVETVQKFSRAFEHSSTFAKELQSSLATSNVISLAHAACLARF